MPRKTVKINPIRGKRLKELISESEYSRTEFASKVGYSPEHLSYIVNGRRNLTEDCAKAVISIFTDVRLEWLLGFDDIKTVSEFDQLPLKRRLTETANQHIIFQAILENFGYRAKLIDNSSVPDLSFDTFRENPAEFFEKFVTLSQQLDKVSYTFSLDGETVGTCSSIEFELLIRDVFAYIEFRLEKLLEE